MIIKEKLKGNGSIKEKLKRNGSIKETAVLEWTVVSEWIVVCYLLLLLFSVVNGFVVPHAASALVVLATYRTGEL